MCQSCAQWRSTYDVGVYVDLEKLKVFGKCELGELLVLNNLIELEICGRKAAYVLLLVTFIYQCNSEIKRHIIPWLCMYSFCADYLIWDL